MTGVQTCALPISKKLSKTFTLQTNCGDIVISLFGSKAPATNTVLTTLAKAGFYDNSVCHRLTTSGLYVLQCGDPLGTGVGGPKFRFKDENLPKPGANNYPAGTVAMANNGPNSNGSQFFLVYANTSLGPNYTIWGKITKGLDIVQYIASKGVVKGGTDGTPAQKISINSVKVA